MIRLHRYPDGRVGLAAFCDTCGKQITERGFVVWNHDPDTDDVTEWRVIHQARCDDPRFECSLPLDRNVVYLAHSAGVDLDATRRDLEEQLDLMGLA